MKVVVSSIGGSLDSQVDPRFGRASTFVLVDTDTSETQSIDNSGGANAAQGAGIQAAETVSRLGAECLITGHCGPKAFRALQAAGIEVYTGASGTVKEAIAQLKSGTLQLSTGSRRGWALGVIVAIASGKGGTGKTTVAVNLALSLSGDVQILDCDVEAPNAHLFLEAQPEGHEVVGILVPEIDADRCNQCGDCSRLCQYNAIAVLGTGVMVFPEMCHGCGGCARVCPEEAISEVMRPIGVVEEGRAGNIHLVQGRLYVGEALVPPLIREVRAKGRDEGMVLIDAPPGTSCSMIAAVRGSDFVVLVTEPTPFGLNDIALAIETVRTLEIPCGVVVNRAGSGDDRVHDYCAAEGLQILLEIPDDRRIAEAYARGLTLVGSVPEVRPLFASLAERIEAMAAIGREPRTEESLAHVRP